MCASEPRGKSAGARGRSTGGRGAREPGAAHALGARGRPSGPEPEPSPALGSEGAVQKLPFAVLLETSAPRSEVAGGRHGPGRSRWARLGGERPGSAVAVPAGDPTLRAQAAGAPGLRSH